MKALVKRAKDFLGAAEAICRANGPDEVLRALLNIVKKQFSAFHTWCALRGQPTGPMTAHAGKKRDGSSVELSDIKLHDKINQAIEKNQFLLLPRITDERKKEKINSAMIAPILGQAGSFGVIYVDNDTSHEHYTLSDLDYLMLIAIHTAVVLENF